MAGNGMLASGTFAYTTRRVLIPPRVLSCSVLCYSVLILLLHPSCRGAERTSELTAQV